jgi:hypothetical protein
VSLTCLSKVLVLLLFILSLQVDCFSQNHYTARAYWQESTKQAYLTIKDKKEKGTTLSADETAYVQDYESYLLSYYNRLSEEEKQRYQSMKAQWDQELASPLITPQAPQQQIEQVEFEWRGRDRAVNAMYGIYYGIALSSILELEDAAAAGLPFITGGLWMLGPAFNSKKYEGITESTIRAANTGKLLGLINGLSLALAIGGDSDETGKLALGLSTIGSITLGEIAFQTQKKKNTSDGTIEIVRHYGIMGPLVGGSILATTDTEDSHLIGLGLLAGGVGGILVGKKAASKYDYSRGDVDALSSLGVISSGLGFAIIANALENNSEVAGAIWLIPASASVAGTLIGQRMVKNVHLTKKQGSTINLSSAGGALFGLGTMLIINSESPTAWIAVPSITSLIAHQMVFSRYKRDNLLKNMQGKNFRGKRFDFSMKLMPENYLINKNTPLKVDADPRLAGANPLVHMTLKFK